MRLSISLILVLLTTCKTIAPQEQENHLAINGHQVHVKTTGTGAPIIFAHGGFLDLEMWGPQVSEFRYTHELIRFSDLGHGKTVNADSPLFGYELINELTRTYPHDKYVLVGLSWGAMLCVDFTLNYPDKVDKLILVSPGLSGWPYFQDSLAAVNYSRRQEAFEDGDTLEAARLFHQNWVIGPRRKGDELDPSFHSESLEMIERNMRDHGSEEWSDLDTLNARTRLEDIRSPTYIIVGQDDAEDILQIAEEYHRRLKISKKIELDGLAHLLTMEDPVRFNQILNDILNE